MIDWLYRLFGIKPRCPRRVIEVKHSGRFVQMLVIGSRGMHLMAELPGKGLGQSFILISRQQAVDPAHYDALWRYYSSVTGKAVWESDGAKYKGG